ncbi:MAG: hypothetical protein SFV23_10060 [Planctomycetaceae bacterium]|nr:hypothetical protein [Planctomycetaceae bacterium]
MTRTQTAAASLVAAIPAGILGALLVMVFLNHAENLKLMTQLLVGGTLAVTAAITFTPFAVLIFGGKKPAAKSPAKVASVSDDEADLVAASDEIVSTGDDEDTETVVYQTSEEDEGTDDLIEADAFGDETDDDLILSDDDVDTVAEEDEPPAKKKGKKK